MSEKDIKNYIEKFPAAEVFHAEMVKYLEDYIDYLILVKSDGTSASHGAIIHEFLNYLFGHHLIGHLEDISVSMANSKFYANYKFHNEQTISSQEMKKVLKGYFTFLYGKYNIKNEKIMRGFDKV